MIFLFLYNFHNIAILFLDEYFNCNNFDNSLISVEDYKSYYQVDKGWKYMFIIKLRKIMN